MKPDDPVVLRPWFQASASRRTIVQWACAVAVLSLAASSSADTDVHSAHGQQERTPLAPGYSKLTYDVPVAGTYELPPLGPAANASFIGVDIEPGEMHELFAGRITVLSFIYTSCNDVNGCPLATYVLSQVARRVAAADEAAKNVQFVSYSFDIEHDTVEVLARYSSSFNVDGIDWHFLTAPNRSALTNVLDRYGQSVIEGDNHVFSHILRVFLIDSENRIRNIYSTGFLHPDLVLADIRTLLLEQ